MFKNVCLLIPMTHSKKNISGCLKKKPCLQHILYFWVFLPLFLSIFTALSEQKPSHPLLRNFQESPPAGREARASWLVSGLPLFSSGQRPSGSGFESESMQAGQLWAGWGYPHWPFPAPSFRHFLASSFQIRMTFKCYFLTKYHLSALRK